MIEGPANRIHSVSQIETCYRLPLVYEMEAAGFMRALSEHQLTSRAICLKLISDGPDYPPDIGRAKQVLRQSADRLSALLGDIEQWI